MRSWGKNTLIPPSKVKALHRNADAEGVIVNPGMRSLPLCIGFPATLINPASQFLVFPASALDVTGDDFLAAKPLLLAWRRLRIHLMMRTFRLCGPKNPSKIDLPSLSSVLPR